MDETLIIEGFWKNAMTTLPCWLEALPLDQTLKEVGDNLTFLRQHMESYEYHSEPRVRFYSLNRSDFDFDEEDYEMMKPTDVEFDQYELCHYVLTKKASELFGSVDWVASPRGAVEAIQVTDEDDTIV